MIVHGTCHCGRISYRAKIDPRMMQVCHCSDCQTLTGSAFRVTVPADPDSFELLSGEPTIYHKVADSGSRRGHAFCAVCGAPVFRLPTDNTPSYALRIGGLKERDKMPSPARQIWVSRRLSWVTGIVRILGHQGQPSNR